MRGFETDFQATLGIFGLFFWIFAWTRAVRRGYWSEWSPEAAPRRLNVGNMLDVDRYPKCCVNMFNTFTLPYAARHAGRSSHISDSSRSRVLLSSARPAAQDI